MSQSKSLELALAEGLPADPAQAEAGRAKAAELVDTFVRQQALPALDAVLQAADGGNPPAHGGPARETTATAAMLDDEVARFRNLAPDPSESGQ